MYGVEGGGGERMGKKSVLYVIFSAHAGYLGSLFGKHEVSTTANKCYDEWRFIDTIPVTWWAKRYNSTASSGFKGREERVTAVYVSVLVLFHASRFNAGGGGGGG